MMIMITILIICVFTSSSSSSSYRSLLRVDTNNNFVYDASLDHHHGPHGRRQQLAGSDPPVPYTVFKAEFTTNTDFTAADTYSGFQYEDDIFRNTNEPKYAKGKYATNKVRVDLGGIDGNDIYNISAGWSTTFELDEPVDVITIKFRYRVMFPTDFDSGDNLDLLCSVDGTLYGRYGNEYIEQFVGTDDVSDVYPNVFVRGEVVVDDGSSALSAGTHTIALGGHLTHKSRWAQRTNFFYDDIEVIVTPLPPPTSIPTVEPTGPTQSPTMLPTSHDVLILDTDFNVDASGFVIVKDMFVNGDEKYTYGKYSSNAGRDGSGGIQMRLGGVDDVVATNMSAGWRYTFTVEHDMLITIEFDYSVLYAHIYGINDESFVLVGLDGTNVVEVDHFNESTPPGTSEWKTVTFDLGVANAGMEHYIDIGGINNQKDHANKRTIIYSDNVRLVGTYLSDPEETTTTTTEPSAKSSPQPSELPSMEPSASYQPSAIPSSEPSSSFQPSVVPSSEPSSQPSVVPSSEPSSQPSGIPSTSQPSSIPSSEPSSVPSVMPSSVPTTSSPTGYPVPESSPILIETGFDADMDGFQYRDHPWGFLVREDNAANYVSGSYSPTGGRPDGTLRIDFGGIDGKDIFFGMSGGFYKEITITTAKFVSVSFSYFVDYSVKYDEDEYVEVLCMVNGELIGQGGNRYVDYTTKGLGDIPWKDVTLDVGTLLAGTYNITIGGHNNQKTNRNEFTVMYFDNVMVTGVDPPSLSPSMSSAPSGPSAAPSSAPAWEIVPPTSGSLKNRHEACFVMVEEKAYLLGGRGVKPVDIYDPSTRSWSVGTGPGLEVHHFQCVAVGDSIYIASAWTGRYPREINLDVVMVYNTTTDTWTNKTALPEPRRRGGGSAVAVGTKIYVTHGNRGGHGRHATALAWTDVYDTETDTWETNLANGRFARDHTGGALMADGRRICVAAGRDGGSGAFFNSVIMPTECYDIPTNTWTVHDDIPLGRAGAAYGTTCDGELMVAGGEGRGFAFDNVDVFDGSRWKTVDSLNQARHGTGLAVSCTCNQIHIASGSGSQGGSPELPTLETLFPNGVNTVCPIPPP